MIDYCYPGINLSLEFPFKGEVKQTLTENVENRKFIALLSGLELGRYTD